MGRVLAFDEFVGRFAAEFGLDHADAPTLVRGTRLVGDLGFDSLELFRVNILLDMLAGVLVPEDLDAMADFTLGDVHYYYVTYLEQQAEAARRDEPGP